MQQGGQRIVIAKQAIEIGQESSPLDLQLTAVAILIGELQLVFQALHPEESDPIIAVLIRLMRQTNAVVPVPAMVVTAYPVLRGQLPAEGLLGIWK